MDLLPVLQNQHLVMGAGFAVLLYFLHPISGVFSKVFDHPDRLDPVSLQ